MSVSPEKRPLLDSLNPTEEIEDTPHAVPAENNAPRRAQGDLHRYQPRSLTMKACSKGVASAIGIPGTLDHWREPPHCFSNAVSLSERGHVMWGTDLAGQRTFSEAGAHERTDSSQIL